MSLAQDNFFTFTCTDPGIDPDTPASLYFGTHTLTCLESTQSHWVPYPCKNPRLISPLIFHTLISTKSLHISSFIFVNSSFTSETHPLCLLQHMVHQAQNVWHTQSLWLFPSSKETAAAFSSDGRFLFHTYPTTGAGSAVDVLHVPHFWFPINHSPPV